MVKAFHAARDTGLINVRLDNIGSWLAFLE